MPTKTKAEVLAHWRQLEPGRPIRAHAIPYKSKGSTYGHDGIRIEGSPEFIDAILAALKPLLAYEGTATRLGISYGPVTPREGKPANGGDHVCYVKVHERGPEARECRRRYGNW